MLQSGSSWDFWDLCTVAGAAALAVSDLQSTTVGTMRTPQSRHLLPAPPEPHHAAMLVNHRELLQTVLSPKHSMRSETGLASMESQSGD